MQTQLHLFKYYLLSVNASSGPQHSRS